MRVMVFVKSRAGRGMLICSSHRPLVPIVSFLGGYSHLVQEMQASASPRIG